MIRDAKYYRQFEDELMSRQRLTHQQAMAIFESLWEEGRDLGMLPPHDPLEGIESDFRLADILNSCSKSCSPA
jgi:hypothetical protein